MKKLVKIVLALGIVSFASNKTLSAAECRSCEDNCTWNYNRCMGSSSQTPERDAACDAGHDWCIEQCGDATGCFILV